MESSPQQVLPNKQIHVVGGGTIEPIRSHLDLAAHAYGTTARQIAELCSEIMPEMGQPAPDQDG